MSPCIETIILKGDNKIIPSVKKIIKMFCQKKKIITFGKKITKLYNGYLADNQ